MGSVLATGMGVQAGVLAAAASGAGVVEQGGQANVGSAAPARRGVAEFRVGSRIGPNTVLMIDNRPKKLNAHEEMIRTQYDREMEALHALEAGMLPENPNLNFVGDPKLKHMVERGLEQGLFRDTTRVDEMLAKMNRDFLDYYKIPPLSLLHCHAETFIDEVHEEICRKRRHPAGVILSGSPKMVTQARQTDPAVQKTIEVARYCLDHNIPMLGICFGMQLLAYVAYGERGLVDWLEVPKNMGVMVVRGQDDRVHFVDVRPENFSAERQAAKDFRQMVYGKWRVKERPELDGRRRREWHPMLKHAREVQGLEVHSQGLTWPHAGIPDEDVLAVSAQHFRRDRNSQVNREFVRHIVEVLQFGAVAYGTQLHPEATPEFLLAVTHVPAYDRALRAEAQDLDWIRGSLRKYPKFLAEDGKPAWAGQRYLYNWSKYVLLFDYLLRAKKDKRVARDTADKLLDELGIQNPYLRIHLTQMAETRGYKVYRP